MAAHCRFLQKKVLEALYETYRLAKKAIFSSYEVYPVQVIPARLLPKGRKALAWVMQQFKSAVGNCCDNLCTRIGNIV